MPSTEQSAPLAIALGNAKLGERCFVFSRPVGDSCPSSCHFLGNGCYAEHTEARFKNSRSAAFRNFGDFATIQQWQKLRALLMTAAASGFSVRIHERGDFGRDDDLDLDYIAAWRKACVSITEMGEKLPRIWTYTHFHDARLPAALAEFIEVYASVHNAKEIKKCKKLGFQYFALIDTAHKFSKYKRTGPSPDAPRFVVLADQRFLVCPEQRQGRDRVTCTGTKTSTACQFCPKGAGNVAFIVH